ncbi:MAG: ATP-binding protein [Bacteroidales bacterium]|nr:ATP-binding protein [Bacteroidales bacterium]
MKRAFILSVIMVFGAMTSVASAQDLETRSEALRILSIGDAFVQTGNTEKAFSLYDEAYEIAATPREKWIATDRIASLHRNEKHYKEALTKYENLLSDEDLLADSAIMMDVYGRIGQVYFDLNDYVKSMKSYNHVIDYLGKKQIHPELLANMAKTQMVAGDIVEAENMLIKAEELCSGVSSPEILATIYDIRSTLCEKKGELTKALEYKGKFAAQQKAIFDIEKANILDSNSPWAYYQKTENSLNNGHKIEELQSIIDEKQKTIDGMKITTYACVACSVILLCAFIISITIGKKRKKHIKQIATSNNEKMHVMSIVVNDFVTPFNALIGFTELQMQYAQSQNDTELLDYSRTIHNSAQTLFLMVGNVLAWSQIDGQAKAIRKKINVSCEIENIVSNYRLVAEDKGVHVNVSIDDDVEAYVDDNHFNIVLRNVMSNALKYTPKGGRVTISSLVFDGKTSIIVDDTGIGMSTDVVKKINNAAFVESTLGTAQEKGSGLGLTICRELVSANGGHFEVSSTEGKGSTFTIVFNTRS